MRFTALLNGKQTDKFFDVKTMKAAWADFNAYAKKNGFTKSENRACRGNLVWLNAKGDYIELALTADKVNAPLFRQTDNDGYGYWGSAARDVYIQHSCSVLHAWRAAFAFILDKTGWLPEIVSGYLDSTHGRHLIEMMYFAKGTLREKLEAVYTEYKLNKSFDEFAKTFEEKNWYADRF